jgi:hypothetical protein
MSSLGSGLLLLMGTSMVDSDDGSTVSKSATTVDATDSTRADVSGLDIGWMFVSAPPISSSAFCK